MKQFLLPLVLACGLAERAAAQSPLTDVRLLGPNVFIPTVPVADDVGVAFLDYRGSGYGVYFIAAASGAETQLQSVYYAEPEVGYSGSRVAWVGYTQSSAQADLYVYNRTLGTTQRITSDAAFQNHPVLSGDRLIWQDYRNAGTSGQNADIYAYDFASGTTRAVTTAPGYQDLPALWGHRAVWQDFRHAGSTLSTSEVYAYDFSTGAETRLTTGSAYRAHPDIWEHLVVWEDYRNGTNGDIYLYDLVLRQERAISIYPSHKTKPQVHGEWVVWLDYRNGSVADLYGFNLRTNQEHPLVVHEAHQDGVALAGTRLIWQDYRNGRVDLYAGTLGGSTTSSEKATEFVETQPYPNPSNDRVSFGRHPGGGPWTLAITDIRGREMVRHHGSGNGPAWDGRDALGQPVPPGLYIATLEFAGAVTRHPLVRLP